MPGGLEASEGAAMEQIHGRASPLPPLDLDVEALLADLHDRPPAPAGGTSEAGGSSAGAAAAAQETPIAPVDAAAQETPVAEELAPTEEPANSAESATTVHQALCSPLLRGSQTPLGEGTHGKAYPVLQVRGCPAIIPYAAGSQYLVAAVAVICVFLWLQLRLWLWLWL